MYRRCLTSACPVSAKKEQCSSSTRSSGHLIGCVVEVDINQDGVKQGPPPSPPKLRTILAQRLVTLGEVTGGSGASPFLAKGEECTAIDHRGKLQSDLGGAVARFTSDKAEGIE